MKHLLLVVFFVFSLRAEALAAAIAHCFVEQNTEQTTTSSTMSDVTGAVIDDATCPLVEGKKYLISITFQTRNDVNTIPAEYDIVHGSTSFLDGVIEHRVGDATGAMIANHFITVWTAVSGEDIKIRFRSPNNTNTIKIDQIAMFAMNLSDNLTENTDWFFAERTTNDALSTTPSDGASVTFTPGTASHDWLVIAYALIHNGSQNTSQIISRLVRSGEAASTDPEWRVETVNTTSQRYAYAISRVFSLGAAENTFKEQSAGGATAGTRVHSAIFALNLNKFKNHANAYTAADAATSATNYATQAQTISITPDVQSNVYIGAFWGIDHGNAAIEGEFRIQVDNSDVPPAQTTDNYQFSGNSNDNADEIPMMITTFVSNMTAAAHTIDLDVSTDSASTMQYRSLWAFTMELAAPTGGGSMGLLGVGK